MNADSSIMRDALTETREAKINLEEALRGFSSARGWGIFDMLGGGLISTLIKHGKIGNANEYLRSAQAHLERVRSLLNGASTPEIQDETGGFAMFADFVFDGLFADIFMQSKIARQQENVQRLYEQVCALERELQKSVSRL